MKDEFRWDGRLLKLAKQQEPGGPEYAVKLSVVALRDLALPSPGTRRRQEIVLSGSQLLALAGTSLCGVLLFVWALTKLWLFGR